MKTRTVLIPTGLNPAQWWSAPPETPLWVVGGDTMGTSWQLRVVAFPDAAPAQLRMEVEGVFARIIAQMSPWKETSELVGYGAAAAGSWVPVSAEFFRVLEVAQAVSEATAGAFDPTVGKAVQLLGLGPTPATAPLPEARAAALQALRATGDAAPALRLDPVKQRVWQPGGVQLDLGAIAKGYAVDLSAQVLRACGARRFFLEIGGEAYGQGVKPDGQPWWCLLETPAGLDADRPETLLALCDLAVATSGNAVRFRAEEGLRVGHILDPQRLDPADASLVSVTVAAESCIEADALATALFVMGLDAGLTHARTHAIAARFLVQATEATPLTEHFSEAMAAMLE